jgi:hypothetical protein
VGHGLGSEGSLYRGLASLPVIQHEVTGKGQEWRLHKLLHHISGGRMITIGLQASSCPNEEEAVTNEGIELLCCPFRVKFQATH